MGSPGKRSLPRQRDEQTLDLEAHHPEVKDKTQPGRSKRQTRIDRDRRVVGVLRVAETGTHGPDPKHRDEDEQEAREVEHQDAYGDQPEPNDLRPWRGGRED